MLMGLPDDSNAMTVSLDYCDTVNSNIELFLKDKPHRMSFSLENAEEDYRKFWKAIRAKGDLNAALSEFGVLYNASKVPERKRENLP